MDPIVRCAMRELKIGAMPEVRTRMVKRFGLGRSEHWAKLCSRVQERCLECPCQPEGQRKVQSPAHVLVDCGFSAPARAAAVQAADAVVQHMGQAGVSAWWGSKSAADKVWYLLRPVSELAECADLQLRGCAGVAWVRGMELARALVVDANGGFGELVSRLAREADVQLVAV